MNTHIADNWYETFFSGINCEMWEKAGTKEMTDGEVAFLTSIFMLPEGSAILDIPCGTGRHSIELAKMGYHLTAVDISETFINALKKKVAEQKLNIEIIKGNVITLNLQGSFDAAFCIGNSFGYFKYEDMKTFVQNVASVLKPGAKWIVNTGLAAESFLAKFIKEKKFELEGLTMQINNDYDEWNSCLLTTLTYTKNGEQQVEYFKQHVYTIAEMIRLLREYNLKTIHLYSSVNKNEYELGDQQIFIVAEKL